MIEKNDILYFFIVVIVAAAIASAIGGMTHEPVPLQVDSNRLPVTTYSPAPAPAPAMQTYAPQLVPGSYADTHRNSTDNGKFRPAPAPVVVTTAPLPTITEIPTSVPAPTTTCCNNGLNATQSSIAGTMGTAFNIMGIAFVFGGIMMMLLIIMPIVRMDTEYANSTLIAGIVMLLVGAGAYVMGGIVLQSLMAATPMIGGGCGPC